MKIIGRHDGFVVSVAFSPDGTRIASGGSDYTVRLWELVHSTIFNKSTNRDCGITGQIIGRHNFYVNSIAFSPDGTKIVSGGTDNTVRLWDLMNETSQLVGKYYESITSVAFSPDGKKIAFNNEQNVILWDLISKTEQIIGSHEDSISSVIFSPDGRKIASGTSNYEIILWDLSFPHGNELTNGENQLVEKYDDSVWVIAFHPDGTKIVSGGYYGIKLWDLTLKKSKIIDSNDTVHTIAFSPDGKSIVYGKRDTIRICDLTCKTTRIIGKDSGSGFNSGWISSVVFSPDGKTIASGGWDKIVRLWVNPFWIRNIKKKLLK